MYRSLLVPLDRSPFAEHALPWALSVARRAEARLDLVQVHVLYALEERTAGRFAPDPRLDAERQAEEQLYLDGTAKWLSSLSRVAVTGHVLAGSAVVASTVADRILERAKDTHADLIVMATHGRDPVNRFFVGSVADELLRRAEAPVLLVRPCATAAELVPEPVLENVLVPLDGSALAEQALAPALELASLMGARCTLLRIIESANARQQRAEESVARAYLERTLGRLGEQAVPVEGLTAVGQGAAETILQTAQPQDAIALATHGRGGIRRLALGSVADEVVRGATTPVLVYRPPAA